MLVEEPLMVFVVVKMLRRQHRRDDRHVGIQLHAHQSIDDRVADEFMPIDPTVHHKARGDDRSVATRPSQQLGLKRYLEHARHFEKIDQRRGRAEPLKLSFKCDPALMSISRASTIG